MAAVETTVEGSPVSLTIDFASLEHGPVYPARSVTTATWQEFQLEIATENSDYALRHSSRTRHDRLVLGPEPRGEPP